MIKNIKIDFLKNTHLVLMFDDQNNILMIILITISK